MTATQSTARPPFAPVPQAMTAREAAAYIGLNVYSLYRKTAAKEIVAVVWGKGRNLRWRKDDLDSWLAALPKREGPVREKPGTRREPERAGA